MKQNNFKEVLDMSRKDKYCHIFIFDLLPRKCHISAAILQCYGERPPKKLRVSQTYVVLKQCCILLSS